MRQPDSGVSREWETFARRDWHRRKCGNGMSLIGAPGLMNTRIYYTELERGRRVIRIKESRKPDSAVSLASCQAATCEAI